MREAARGGVFFEPLRRVGLGEGQRCRRHTARRGNGAQAAIDEPFAAVDVVRAPLVLAFADGAGFPLGLQLFQFAVLFLQELLPGGIDFMVDLGLACNLEKFFHYKLHLPVSSSGSWVPQSSESI